MENKALDKNVRYDRQLRLWGQQGQDGLQAARIGVLHSSATSAEVLKNLVLPGIGSFTIIDDALVTAADLGNNFFVDAASVGKSRAATVTAMLLEMNPFVTGHAVTENPHTLIDTKLDYFSANFSMVLADGVHEPQLRKLAAHLWQHKIPLLVTRSYGFIGFCRSLVPEHTMVETHPPEVPDLRLHSPWPELQHHMDSVDLEFKDCNEADRVSHHSHVPWLVLLFRFWNQYKATHNGEEPARNTFAKYVLDQRVTNSVTGGKHVEENFDEAAKNAWRAFAKYSIPPRVRELLNDSATAVHKDSSAFWFLVAALKHFVAKEGHNTFLPLPGGIPDMHSSSKNFIALQRVYHDKSEKDVSAMLAHVEHLLHSTGSKLTISREEVQRFCKNAANINVIRATSLADSRNATKGDVLSDRLNDEDMPEGKNVLWFLILEAIGSFQAKHVRYPGQSDTDVAGDVALLRAELTHVMSTYGVKPSDEVQAQVDDHLAEAVRYGGCELHNIAAFMGGVVSLEMIKLATHQWIPLHNTFIFNGINGTSVQLEL